MTLLYVLAALLLLGILVVVHEGGHFWAARLTGIPVREFSVGFGPVLLKRKSKKHDTVFTLRLIPAGGFCAFYGEDDPNEESRKDPRAFANAPVWKRIVTVFMGPGMNFILALLVAFGFYLIGGEVTDVVYGKCTLVSVTEDGAAALGGLQAGDIVDSINGQDASGTDAEGNLRLTSLIAAYQEGDAPLRFGVTRGSETAEFDVTPVYNAQEGRMMTGIVIQPEAKYVYSPVTIGRAVELGADYCWRAGTSIWTSLWNLVTKGEGIENTGGPVRIVQMITEETKTYGLEAYVGLLILISVNLGLVNLLPIPGLDGSRILFLIVEAIMRRPLNRKVEAYIQTAGLFVLMGLFLVLTYRDVMHLFQ